MFRPRQERIFTQIYFKFENIKKSFWAENTDSFARIISNLLKYFFSPFCSGNRQHSQNACPSLTQNPATFIHFSSLWIFTTPACAPGLRPTILPRRLAKKESARNLLQLACQPRRRWCPSRLVCVALRVAHFPGRRPPSATLLNGIQNAPDIRTEFLFFPCSPPGVVRLSGISPSCFLWLIAGFWGFWMSLVLFGASRQDDDCWWQDRRWDLSAGSNSHRTYDRTMPQSSFVWCEIMPRWCRSCVQWRWLR